MPSRRHRRGLCPREGFFTARLLNGERGAMAQRVIFRALEFTGRALWVRKLK